MMPVFASNETKLFRVIGSNLSKNVSAFLVGGENLRLKGLKHGDKHDYDFVLAQDGDFETFIAAALSAGFKPSAIEAQQKMPGQRLQTRQILEHPEFGLLDIFDLEIGKNRCYLSDKMRERALKKTFGKLNLGILDNADVFLLKAVAGRPKDEEDLLAIAGSENLDWSVIWGELKRQEKDTGHYISRFLIGAIEDLKDRGLKEPLFFKHLVRRALDKEIIRYIRNDEKPLDEVVSMVAQNGVTEQMVLNRIEYLKDHKKLKKILKHDNSIMLKLRGQGKFGTYRIYEPASVYQAALKCIEPIARKSRLSEGVKGRATEIINEMYNRGLLGGRMAEASVAPALWIAAESFGEAQYRSVTYFYKTAGVSGYSFYENYRRIKNELKL